MGCEGLQEEYEYKFRVCAVNRAGKGEPGPASDSIIAMHKNIPPFIKGDGLSDIKVRVGRPIRFDVWVGGEPPPSIEWYRNDVRVRNDGDTAISVYSTTSSAYTLKNVVLSIPKVLEEEHNGTYTLKLSNESGVYESVATVDIDGPLKEKLKR